MPVPAVIPAGMPTVSPGSQITTPGIIFGMEDDLLGVRGSSVMTPARPTSEPVPAVVGTATTGAMPSGSARVHQSPTSSKSHIGRVWPAMKAMSLPMSSAAAAAEGDDAVMPAGAIGLQPVLQVRIDRVGLHVGEHAARARGAQHVERSALIGRPASPRSVTNSGRAMPCARSLGQFGDTPGAEADGGRIVPVGGQVMSISTQVEGLRPGQGFVADPGQGCAAAGVLDAGPGQRGVEVVAPVHEDGARLDLAADPLGRRESPVQMEAVSP